MAKTPGGVNKTQAVRDYLKTHPGALSAEISDALGKQGITITRQHVANIKSKVKERRLAKKVAAGNGSAAHSHKRAGNKTQAVRDYLHTHPTAKNQEVVEALASKGITVATSYVSNIKATRKNRRREVNKVVARSGVGIPEVKAALALLKACGTFSAAKEALTAAEEIKAMV